MRTRTSMGWLVSAVVAATGCLVGCRSDVPKEDMDAIAKWSSAACACAEKTPASAAASCGVALKKPTFSLVTPEGKPKHTPESSTLYAQLQERGDKCMAKIR